MNSNIKCPFLVYLGIMSKSCLEELGNPKYETNGLSWNRGKHFRGHDGIRGMSKHLMKPLKFCLKSHSL